MRRQYFHVVVDRWLDVQVHRQRLRHSVCGTDFRQRRWTDHRYVEENQFLLQDGEKMDAQQNLGGPILAVDPTSVVVAHLPQLVAVVVAVFRKHYYPVAVLVVVVLVVVAFQKDYYLGEELRVAE
jgi:hypothetical protein